MAIGSLLGAIFSFGATVFGSVSIFGFTVSGLWVLGAAYALSGSSSFSIRSPNYSLDPIQNTLSGYVPVPVAYGRNRIAGNIFYEQFGDDTKSTMYCHVALSEGPIVAGGVGFNDVMVNDFTTAELGTIDKEVFMGTVDQEPGSYDPEGLSYPLLAYVSLKMTANSKVQGRPVITTVFNGRDLDYPMKGEEGGDLIAADTTVAQYITLSNTKVGYKQITSSLDALGHARYRKLEGYDEEGFPEYSYRTVDYPTFSFLSSTYSPGGTNTICIPWSWIQTKPLISSWDTYAYQVRLFPDSTNDNIYYDFSINVPSDVTKSFTVWGDDQTALHWELRRFAEEEGIISRKYYSGVLYLRVPGALVVPSGNAKIQVTRTYYSGTTPSLVYPSVPDGYSRHSSGDTSMAGLLNYDDILTDSPFGSWVVSDALANPAWVLYDLLTNQRYGAGIPVAFIDVDSFSEVASRCSEEGISFNFIFDRQQPILDHLSEVLAHFRGWMLVRDKIYIGMDAPVLAPIATITADDIVVGSFSWFENPSDQVPNWLTVEYTDGDGEGNGGTWERVSVDAIDYDDVEKRGVVQSSYSLLGINDRLQAEKMADFLLAKSKYCQVCCSFSTALHQSDIEVGDVIAITYDLPGWTEQWVRVMSVTDEESGTIRITGVVYDDRIYAGLTGGGS